MDFYHTANPYKYGHIENLGHSFKSVCWDILNKIRDGNDFMNVQNLGNLIQILLF